MQKHLISTFALLLALGGCSAEMSVEPPTIVMNGFNRDHPGATVSNVEESKADGRTQYSYHYTDANGNKKTVAYDSQGNAVSGNH
jgi:hypothetical protein